MQSGKDIVVAIGGMALSFCLLMLLGFGAFWSTVLTLAIGRYVVYAVTAAIQLMLDSRRSAPQSAGLPGGPIQKSHPGQDGQSRTAGT
jgi:hypothetical protein